MNKLVVFLSFALGVAITAGVASAQDAGTALLRAEERPVAHQPREFRFERVLVDFNGVHAESTRILLEKASAEGWTFETFITGMMDGRPQQVMLSRSKQR